MKVLRPLTLITQRSIEEGVAMEIGKMSPEYFDACSVIEMNELDMDLLGITPQMPVRVTSAYGSVIAKAIIAVQTCESGLCMMRQGVWANQVVPAQTQSTGAPLYSGFPVTVRPAPADRIVPALELLLRSVGMWKDGDPCHE